MAKAGPPSGSSRAGTAPGGSGTGLAAGGGPVGGRPAGPRSAGTRSSLVAGAISALREVGFARASAREIARRAGCNQALVFYHFGSVAGLLLAALDDISARRLAAYREQVARAGTVAELVESARAIFTEDLDAGHVTFLVEMITAAQSEPGFGEQVAARLRPWRDFAETAIRDVLASSPMGQLVPAAQVAHGMVAGFLGLELLANIDGDRSAALAMFDSARTLAGLIDLLGPPRAPQPERRD